MKRVIPKMLLLLELISSDNQPHLVCCADPVSIIDEVRELECTGYRCRISGPTQNILYESHRNINRFQVQTEHGLWSALGYQQNSITKSGIVSWLQKMCKAGYHVKNVKLINKTLKFILSRDKCPTQDWLKEGF